MHTINATLQTALSTHHFSPYFKLLVYEDGDLVSTLDVLKYKLTGTHLSVTARGLIIPSSQPESVKVVLSRGITQLGTNYVLNTSKFTPITGKVEKVAPKALFVNSHIEAELIPPMTVGTINASQTYQQVITDFCTAIGKTAAFKDPGADFWQLAFMPNGTGLTLNNAQLFFPLLASKRLIYCCDNGGEELLFYSAFDMPADADASIDPIIYNVGTGYFGRRRFYSTDEDGVVHFAGTEGDPLWNLGYLYSLAPMPDMFEQAQPVDFEVPINLNYQDGDLYAVDSGTYLIYPAEVIETFDPKLSPGWKVAVNQKIYFTSTEGGALPLELMKSSAYMPIDTSSFDGVLNGYANNVQAALNMLDDHTHAGGPGGGWTPPVTTAADDFMVGDGAGSWIKHTIAQVITSLRVTLDAAYNALYAAIGHTHASYLTDAPSDGSTYGRKNAAWAAVAAGGGATDHIQSGHGALTQTEGYLQWNDTRKLITLWDTQRERGITPEGWAPFALPIGLTVQSAAPSAAITAPAAGGSIAIPILLTAPMLLESVTWWDTSTSTARIVGWDLYEQYLNNGNAGENTLTRVAASNGNLSYTPSVASLRTLGASGAPVFLAPGLYWLVMQSRHASSTFTLGEYPTFAFGSWIQTKTTSNPNGATLDFVAASWTKISNQIPCVRLNGRVFGQTTVF